MRESKVEKIGHHRDLKLRLPGGVVVNADYIEDDDGDWYDFFIDGEHLNPGEPWWVEDQGVPSANQVRRTFRLAGTGVVRMNKVAKRVAARHAKRSYLIGAPTHVHATQSVLAATLASMEAIRWVHWTGHWAVKGDASYGDHLLFERMYNAMTPEIDTLAEKCVGMFGPAAINPFSLMEKASAHIDRFKTLDCLHKRSLAAEEDLQITIRTAYDLLKGMRSLSLGMDDYFMSLANSHETFIYLLQQRIAADEGRAGIEKPPYDFSLVGEPVLTGDPK